MGQKVWEKGIIWWWLRQENVVLFFLASCEWWVFVELQAQDTDTGTAHRQTDMQTHPGTITDKWTDTNHANAEDKVKPRSPYGFESMAIQLQLA